jgi:hypothetical protein
MSVRRHRKLLVALLGVLACRRAADPQPPPAAAPPADPTRALLATVVDPWRWPRAAGTTDRERALEDIGPYEPADRAAAGAPLVNTDAHYWTALVGIAWSRDVDIDLDLEPVDLDGDGAPDTRVTRHVHARGGVLANPELFGLTPTPADPRGRIGRVSVSTGVLGLREALRPDGTPSGQIGMTCWLCHGGAHPVTGQPTLGLPGARFDYGLLLATAAVLDDANATAAAYRRARGVPPGRSVRARLLLAGPGRQDLTGEFGLDVTVPGYHSAAYPGTRRVRQGIRGVTNPISVPGILAAPGLALENWSGSENAAAPFLERLAALAGRPEADVVAAFGLAPPGADRAIARRALLLDLRNLGTLGLQQDSFPGLLWADALGGRAGLPPEAVASIPPLYGTVAVRRALAAEAAALPRPAHDRARVERGRALFTDRVVGEVANRQILKQAPRAYAAAKLEGPVLAPIDASRPLEAKLAVRCADCHNAAPLEGTAPLAANPPPLGRCTHCHWTHREKDDVVSIRSLPVPAAAREEVAYCEGCHTSHRLFGPLVYSSSRLLPFDADGDGDAQGDEAADARAGGIGTDPLLAFDVPRPERPFAMEIPVLGDLTRPGRVGRARIGVAWVRTPPLIAVFATAPYLHDGSVPTLRALLEPPRRRPVTFPLGAAGFVLDTRLPGNHNGGHDFGAKLTPAEKDDLCAFLESL